MHERQEIPFDEPERSAVDDLADLLPSTPLAETPAATAEPETAEQSAPNRPRQEMVSRVAAAWQRAKARQQGRRW